MHNCLCLDKLQLSFPLTCDLRGQSYKLFFAVNCRCDDFEAGFGKQKIKCPLGKSNYTENTHHMGKDHCMAGFQLNKIGFVQTRKCVVTSTYVVKHTSPNL